MVVLAGKGHEDYQVLAGGSIHFSDIEEAEKALAAEASRR
jgi:UDP-N-acetylmuramyl tripeptide synthase